MNDQLTIHEPVKSTVAVIKIENMGGQLKTDSINVAEVFNKRHGHVIRDIEELNCSLDFREPNFGLSYYNREINGFDRKYKKYEITKDGLMFLIMGYQGEKAAEMKEAYINRFNEMEKALLCICIPSTFAEALQLAANQAKQLENAQPAIEFHEQIADSTGLHTVAEVAKMLGTGRNRLFEWLRESAILRGNNEPYQSFIDQGYFEVKESLNNKHVNAQTFVTPKGLVWLQGRWGII